MNATMEIYALREVDPVIFFVPDNVDDDADDDDGGGDGDGDGDIPLGLDKNKEIRGRNEM